MAKANTTNYGLADNLDFSKPKRNNTNVINNTKIYHNSYKDNICMKAKYKIIIK